jgi:hypothetical protein
MSAMSSVNTGAARPTWCTSQLRRPWLRQHVAQQRLVQRREALWLHDEHEHCMAAVVLLSPRACSEGECQS